MPQDLDAIRAELEAIRVELGAAADAWRHDFGVTAIFLNDIAAGALVEVPEGWTKEGAPDAVSRGLRRLLQELWRQDLARPVLAVFWPGKGASEDAVKEPVNALDRLTWDQDAHRGDFALRRAQDEDEAKALLWTLMGDTMGALDDSAREDKVGLAEVIATFKDLGPTPETLTGRLTEAVLAELRRVAGSTGDPDLVEVLGAWRRAEGEQP